MHTAEFGQRPTHELEHFRRWADTLCGRQNHIALSRTVTVGPVGIEPTTKGL